MYHWHDHLNKSKPVKQKDDSAEKKTNNVRESQKASWYFISFLYINNDKYLTILKELLKSKFLFQSP